MVNRSNQAVTIFASYHFIGLVQEFGKTYCHFCENIEYVQISSNVIGMLAFEESELTSFISLNPPNIIM